MKASSSGGSLWMKMFGEPGLDERGDDARQTIDGGYIITGATNVSGPAYEVYLIKTDDEGLFTSVHDAGQSTGPMQFRLLQNYPNPFNPSTTIAYELKDSIHAELNVYDILGREVATLANEQQSPGRYKVRWDANGVASGVYFQPPLAGDFVQTKILLLLK